MTIFKVVLPYKIYTDCGKYKFEVSIKPINENASDVLWKQGKLIDDIVHEAIAKAVYRYKREQNDNSNQ